MNVPPLLRVSAAFVCATVSSTFAFAADQLRDAPSAFLRQHATSPVDWMTWGEAAFARAKKEQKPIFVAVGLFTSELSRAMSRQTFSNAETAALLNENFVCVLVDAKEHRDVAQLYQNYISSAKQLTGMPMNLFLTPEWKPFEGANYLPPTEEWGKEGFGTVSKRALAGWKSDTAAQRTKADEAVAAVLAAQHAPAPAAIDAAAGATLLTEALDAWKARADAANGGFGDPPKYVEPELLRCLLRDAGSREVALQTLRAAANGAARDPLDGGFFRYVMDAEWHQPYFQKNLVDQPRVALAFLEAAATEKDPLLAEAARGALLFAVKDLGGTTKDAAAAQDATAETLVTSFLWSLDEIKDVLGAEASAAFASTYGATPEGNLAADSFPNVTTTGKNLLRRVTPRGDATAEKKLTAAAASLHERRKQRPAPLRDNAAPASTHGILLAGLARAGAQLQDAELAGFAKTEFELLRSTFVQKDGSLIRLPGSTAIATADDYAAVIAGLLEYQAATNDRGAGDLATKLLTQLKTGFWDENAGRFYATGSENNDTGIWGRVHFVAPGVGEPAAPETTLLLTLSEHSIAGDTAPALKAALARTVAAEIRESAEVARGDLLLAFQAFQKTR